MRKVITFLFLLISCNCFGIAKELEEFLYEEESYIGHYKEHLQRFITVVDKLEGLQNPTQKEILKVILSIESSILENNCMLTVELFEGELAYYKSKMAYAQSESEKSNYIKCIDDTKNVINLFLDRVRIIHQVTDELTHD